MIRTKEDLAFLANDLFNKRQRLMQAGRSRVDVFDERTAQALEVEYRAAEAEYMAAKAAFARAMKEDRRAS